MTDIVIADITNASDTETGTGSFDVLIASVERRINCQFDLGRITGVDYATVYLGSMQHVLKNALDFVMQEQTTGLQADLLAQQIVQEAEKTDMIIAQTAAAYEQIEASQAKTRREDILNNKQVIKIQKDTILVEKQTDKVIEEVLKTVAETTLIDQRIITEIAQTVDPTGGMTLAKQDLVEAQTLGFASDTKQKVLKLMLDGYAVTLSIAGTATVPDAATEPFIDALVHEILDDIGSTAMSNSAGVPDIGA